MPSLEKLLYRGFFAKKFKTVSNTKNIFIKKSLTDLRIVFMGTPEFAVASLSKLLVAQCKIVAVVTAPDKPSGRGMHPGSSPVKKYAEINNIPVLQPLKLRESQFLEDLQKFNADLFIVVAFRMLPEAVWQMPPMGTINVHGSLLPDYRGAAPINWAIINGEKKTGVTTFKLKHAIDTGDILLSRDISIGENETAGELHDRMKEIGAELLLKTILEIANETSSETPQPVAPSVSKHAPKIFTETARINWSQEMPKVYNLIRGLSPYPGAFTELQGKTLKIYKAEMEYSRLPGSPGVYETDGKHFLKFACRDGFISLKELQLEGKKRMGVEEFLRGMRGL